MEIKAQGRRRGSKNYANEFRTQVVAETRDPTRSLAEVARAHGLNANLVSKWRRDQEQEATSAGVVALIGPSDEVRPMFMISGNANGLRTCQVRHVVQHAHADGNLGRLRFGASCPQAVTRERLEAIHRVLRERAPMVAAVLLPFAAAESGDRIDRVVAPRRARRVRGPMSSAFTRRNRGHCAARGDRGMAWLGVVGPVTADDLEQLVIRDLVEQFGQDVTVGDVLMRHQRGTHLTGVRVEPEMDFAPRATLRIAMLAYLPFAFAID
ncbi:hypothetical protein BOC41_11985 [Burkholderia pseudomallei]|nr:hypothetical protein BOC41_11985 [Burkholderia pseudomallei]